jgi:hypothetical protein
LPFPREFVRVFAGFCVGTPDAIALCITINTKKWSNKMENISIEKIIEKAEEKATSCKSVWGMDNADYAFAIGATHSDSLCFCVIGGDCFEAITTGDCYGTRKPGNKISLDVVMGWLDQQ